MASLHNVLLWLQAKASKFGGKSQMKILSLQDAIALFHHCLSLIVSGPKVFTCLHVAAAIETFQSQLEEHLLVASNTLVTQVREQARAITEEAHATTLVHLSPTCARFFSKKCASLLMTLACPPELMARVAPMALEPPRI